jgi:hypothetical protein
MEPATEPASAPASEANPALASIGDRLRRGFDELLTLFAGPFVLAALMLTIAIVAFNLWPTFNRISEWGD